MKKNLLAVLTLIAVFFPDSAHAYLDAGTASIVFQAIIAALVGAAVTAKIYWRGLSGWMRSFSFGKSKDEK